MTRSRPIKFLAGTAMIPLAALTVAACGSGSGSGNATAATPPPTTSSSASAKVEVAKSRLGSILVDSAGRTLYLFKADKGTKSACSGACAAAWPPLPTTGKPTAGAGVSASKLGTITRSGGQRQVTYNGHPLYTFVKDHKRGDVMGQGVTAFGASWFAVSPAGSQIASRPTTHGGGSSSSRPTAPAAPKPAAKPAAPPAAKPAPANNGIPQNNGGDGDADNNGGPSDGDGGI